MNYQSSIINRQSSILSYPLTIIPPFFLCRTHVTYLKAFITRIPGTLAIEQQLIDQAWSIDSWQPIVEMALLADGESIPNQIGQPTQKPTLRWLFQLLEGIHCVAFSFEGKVRRIIEGLTDLRKKIIRLFGKTVIKIYHLSLSESSP